jgi:hypothetical protein
VNYSEAVQEEIALAIRNDVEVVLFRIEDCDPNERLSKLLAGARRLDAWKAPAEKQLATLTATVKELLAAN